VDGVRDADVAPIHTDAVGLARIHERIRAIGAGDTADRVPWCVVLLPIVRIETAVTRIHERIRAIGAGDIADRAPWCLVLPPIVRIVTAVHGL
jgi:hypothetical protein